jgi:hypothetical protein
MKLLLNSTWKEKYPDNENANKNHSPVAKFSTSWFNIGSILQK